MSFRHSAQVVDLQKRVDELERAIAEHYIGTHRAPGCASAVDRKLWDVILEKPRQAPQACACGAKVETRYRGEGMCRRCADEAIQARWERLPG